MCSGGSTSLPQGADSTACVPKPLLQQYGGGSYTRPGQEARIALHVGLAAAGKAHGNNYVKISTKRVKVTYTIQTPIMRQALFLLL